MIYKITIFNAIKNELQFTDTEGTISPLLSHTIIEDDVYVESAEILWIMIRTALNLIFL